MICPLFRLVWPRVFGLGMILCSISASLNAGSASSLLDISHDGALLVCSNRDSGTITFVDLSTHQVTREIAVGKKPEGVSFIGSTHQVAVAIYAEDRVVLVNGDTGETPGTIDVFDEPYGVVSSANGETLYVTLDYPGRVVEIDVRDRSIRREIAAGAFTRGVALAPDQRRLYVTEYYTANVMAIDTETGMVVDRWIGTTSDNLSRQIVLHPQRPKAYLTHVRSRVKVVHGEGSIFPSVSILDTGPTPADDPDASRRHHIPMDSFRGALVTANPWDCAISSDGRQFFVVFAGTDDMFACDVVDDDYREIRFRDYQKIGKNPRAVRVSPDNQRVYVYHALDFNIVAYDAQSLGEVATIPVTTCPLDEEHLRGKILFYSALQPMASRRWISCASCHPDGDPDGRTWSNPEGPRNTQSLAGMAWTHPIHWSADRDEVQDFEHTIRGRLMQGRGLLAFSTELQTELGPPNAGRSRDLDALAAYSDSHPLALSPHAKQGLSESAQRGRDIFFSEQTRCAQCHSGPYYTDSQPRESLIRHNVGTGGDPAEKLAPEFDTPSLLGVYRTAPYLHHGQAATLEAVVTTSNPRDEHGVTSHLSSHEVTDLVEFLKALPYEDPEPRAIEANLKKVTR